MPNYRKQRDLIDRLAQRAKNTTLKHIILSAKEFPDVIKENGKQFWIGQILITFQ